MLEQCMQDLLYRYIQIHTEYKSNGFGIYDYSSARVIVPDMREPSQSTQVA